MKILVGGALAILSVIFFVTQLPAQKVDQERAQYQLAQQYEASGDFTRALQIYLTLYQKNPDNFTYFDALCHSYISLRQYDDLISLIENRLQQEPDNLQYRIRLGDVYLQKGDEKKAFQIWEQLLQQNRKNAAVYRMVANTLLQSRQFDRGVEIYEKGRLEIGDPSLFALELAQLHTYRLNYERATDEYLRFLHSNPTQLSFVEARIAAFKGDSRTYDQVTSTIRRWLNRESDQIILRKLFISFLISYEDFTTAFTEVKELEKIKVRFEDKALPGSELYQFGLESIKEKQYALAENALLSILQDYPAYRDRSEVEFELARTFYLQKKLEPALRLFDQVAKKYPNTSRALAAYQTRGEIYLIDLFLPDSAAACFRQVLQYFPTNENAAVAMLASGDVEVAKGNLSQAEKYYLQAQQFPLRNAILRQDVPIQANLKLAELSFYRKDFNKAKKTLQMVLQYQTGNMSNVYVNDALDLLLLIEKNVSDYSEALEKYADAILNVQQHRYQQGMEQLAAIVASFPDAEIAPRALLHKAQLCEKLGDDLGAVFVYQTIVQQYPKAPVCDLALWQAATLYEEKIKNNAKAVECYEAILLNYPDSMLAEKARQQIRSLEGRP